MTPTDTREEAVHAKRREITSARPPRRAGATSTIFVSGASLSGFEEEAKEKTLRRSIGVLDGWLERNEASAQEVRVRRIKRWREEALQQLRLELNRTIGSP